MGCSQWILSCPARGKREVEAEGAEEQEEQEEEEEEEQQEEEQQEEEQQEVEEEEEEEESAVGCSRLQQVGATGGETEEQRR